MEPPFEVCRAKAKDSKGLTALLVRPDGFVAWVAESEPDLNAVEESVKPWLALPSGAPRTIARCLFSENLSLSTLSPVGCPWLESWAK